jgi:ABC-2 type transport system ATP-binding protein
MNTSLTPSFEAPAIQFSHVTKCIDQKTILDDVCFEVRAGETLAIAGVNGAGKTTLLRCLLDFMKVTSGRVDIFGVASTLASARTPLAFLPERFVPPGYLTGHETLVWLAGLRGQTWSEAASRQGFADFAIDPQAMHRPLKFFSKGMTQKIGLMACLILPAPLVVLDEPMSGLDPLARRFFTTALKQAKAQGRTIVFTSHSMLDIETLCDRMALIHNGALIFCGTPVTLRQRFSGASLEEAFIHSIETLEHA